LPAWKGFKIGREGGRILRHAMANASVTRMQGRIYDISDLTPRSTSRSTTDYFREKSVSRFVMRLIRCAENSGG
jgi:hypothetical protein